MVYIDKRKTCVTTNLENYKCPVVSRIIITVNSEYSISKTKKILKKMQRIWNEEPKIKK